MIGFKRVADREAKDALHDEYLRRIDVEQLLDHYGAEHTQRRGNEIIHSCLLDRVAPHHNNGDRNPSASCNVEKKVYSCYTYGGGDIFWFVAQMEGKEHFHEIVPFLGQFLSGGATTNEDFLDELEQYFRSESVKTDTPVFHERVLRNWALYHPYLRDRGVTKEAAATLQLGYDEEAVRLTIPHWVDGVLVGWQKRSLSDERWPQTPPEPVFEGGKIVDHVDPPPKYKNSTNFPKAETVYNLDLVRSRGRRDVVVVESPMSVAKAESFGIHNVLCTFGAKIGEQQIARLREFEEVTVFFDDDSAGRRGAYKLLEGLHRHTTTYHVEPEPGMDMGDYATLSDLSRIMDTREPAVLALMELEKDYGSKRRRG